MTDRVVGRLVGRAADRGSATIWVLACAALACTIATFVVLRTGAVLARHRAESAADLAALAAAGGIGVRSDPCGAARQVAAANAARLQECAVHLDPSGRSGTVTVRVARGVGLPLVGARIVVSSARAGRLVAGSAASQHRAQGGPP